jgi:surfeit locus 1 family protein
MNRLARQMAGVSRWPGWLPTLAAAAALAVTLSAANWQLNRLTYKQALAAQYAQRQTAPPIVLGPQPEPQEMQFRRVQAQGRLDPEKAVLLDNRLRRGKAGFEIVMPLRLAGDAGHVLVNRGWVPLGADRRNLPEVRTPAGTVTVIGTAVFPPEKVYELSPDAAEGRVWQNLTLARYREAYGLRVRGFVIQQQNDLGDDLDRNWPVPGFGIEQHRSYVGQWLIFSALIVILYVYFGFIRKRPAPQD